jgi:hypothetical protein
VLAILLRQRDALNASFSGKVIHGKTESFICEIVKKEKEIHTAFAVAPQAATVIAMVGKCLVKLQKALNLWVEDMSRNVE